MIMHADTRMVLVMKWVRPVWASWSKISSAVMRVAAMEGLVYSRDFFSVIIYQSATAGISHLENKFHVDKVQ
jgi:hypothetical protein